MLSIIVAVAANGVIGNKGKIPWHLPADLAYFKARTMGHTLIMGRRTFESLGKPLRGRRTIVLTRDARFSAPGCAVARTPTEAMDLAGDGEAFVAGGGEVYAAFLSVAQYLYITHVDAVFEGDAIFPPIRTDQWSAISETPGTVDGRNTIPHRFVVYERRVS